MKNKNKTGDKKSVDFTIKRLADVWLKDVGARGKHFKHMKVIRPTIKDGKSVMENDADNRKFKY